MVGPAVTMGSYEIILGYIGPSLHFIAHTKTYKHIQTLQNGLAMFGHVKPALPDGITLNHTGARVIMDHHGL